MELLVWYEEKRDSLVMMNFDEIEVNYFHGLLFNMSVDV